MDNGRITVTAEENAVCACIRIRDEGGGIVNGELINRKFDKGTGIKAICCFLGCSLADTIGFGDSDNDLTMLRAAGLGIAMGNAAQNIRLTADAVTASNAECGVAQAIETYILEEKL